MSEEVFDVTEQADVLDPEWLPSTSTPRSFSQRLINKPRPKSKRKLKTFLRSVLKPRNQSRMRLRWIDDLANMNNDTIQNLPCCSRTCFKLPKIQFLRDKMLYLRSSEENIRRQALFQMLCSNQKYNFDGKYVCNAFLTKAFRFSPQLLSCIRDSVNDVHANFSRNVLRKTVRFDRREESIISNVRPIFQDSETNFLQRLAGDTGDSMPDKDEVHLPFFRTGDVFEVFQKDFKLLYPNTSPPMYSSFMRIWKSNCSDIKVRKSSRFKECTVCVQLRTSLAESARRREPTQLLKAQKQVHNSFIQRERREYTMKKELATLRPKEYISIAVDGADQKAFSIPHFTSDTKDSRGHGLKVHLIGVLQHSSPNRLRLFTMTADHESGANHIIECCRRVFSELYMLKNLPWKAFIRFDNCIRENKNRFVFSYLEFLVTIGLFDEVEASFLPVGHTHCDIDQAFSTTAERLRHNDAITLEDLHTEVQKCYNDQTTVTALKQLGNWSGLCTSQNCLTEIDGLTQFRYFKIISQGKNANDTIEKPIVSVRATIDHTWKKLPTKGTGDVPSFLKFLPALSEMPPESLTCPPDKHDVMLRIQSEESRIIPIHRLSSLYQLVEDVYQNRMVCSHWNIQSGIESIQGHSERDIIDDCEDDCNQILYTTSVSHSYAYELHSLVAVKSGDSEYQLPFWIGEIVEAHRSGNGITPHITVHWYRFYNTDDIYSAKYCRSYGTNKSPWKDKIDTSSVYINFRKLTNEKRLPVAVVNHLRTTVCSES